MMLHTKLIVKLLLFGMFCSQAAYSQAPAKTEIVIDAHKKTRANPYILGNNIQWVDNADGLYDAKAKTFNQALLERIKKLKITSLRFPGGTLSDLYHWKDAVGPHDQRKKGAREQGGDQESNVGTDEFLELCRLLNAEPIITVNTLTGTPEEAAEWVRYCKGRVKYWEIGNEPYLEPVTDKKNINQAYPDIFASKFIAFAKAMKAVDASIQVGLPLRNNQLGRYPSGPYKDWNDRMRPALSSADFVCVHNAYFPGIFNQAEYKDPDSFLALMAAEKEVREDLEVTRNFLRKNSNKDLPIAITEYNTFFAMPGISVANKAVTLAGGLYTASLLTDFFKDRSISMAHFWSLTGNWMFGAVSNKNKTRPQYHALKIFSDYVGPDIVESAVHRGPVFSTVPTGFLPAKQNVDALKVLASVNERDLFVIIVNRALVDIPVSLEINGFDGWRNVTGAEINGPKLSDDNEFFENIYLRRVNPSIFEDLSNVKVPAHSVLAMRLRKKA